MTSRLDAVNEILEALGEPPVDMLDTGGSSIVAEAETVLDRETRRIQKRGWYVNTEFRRTLFRPDNEIIIKNQTGPFAFAETITGRSSKTSATFLYQPEGRLALRVHEVDGTFQSNETLVASTSGASASFSSITDLTDSPIPFDPAWLFVMPADNEWTRFTTRGNLLYFPDQERRHDEADGFKHDDDVEARIIKNLAFTDLTPRLQDYIVQQASVQFQRFKKRGQVDDQFTRTERDQARAAALQEDSDLRNVNTLEADDVLAVKGRRDRVSHHFPHHHH